MSKKKSGPGKRWKRIATFRIHIEIASGARMWRAVTAAEKSEPQSKDSTEPVGIDVSAGETYSVRALIRRRKEQAMPDIAQTLENVDQ